MNKELAWGLGISAEKEELSLFSEVDGRPTKSSKNPRASRFPI